MNRKLRCSKRQTKKIFCKLSAPIPSRHKATLRRLTYREALYLGSGKSDLAFEQHTSSIISKLPYGSLVTGMCLSSLKRVIKGLVKIQVRGSI